MRTCIPVFLPKCCLFQNHPGLPHSQPCTHKNPKFHWEKSRGEQQKRREEKMHLNVERRGSWMSETMVRVEFSQRQSERISHLGKVREEFSWGQSQRSLAGDGLRGIWLGMVREEFGGGWPNFRGRLSSHYIPFPAPHLAESHFRHSIKPSKYTTLSLFV